MRLIQLFLLAGMCAAFFVYLRFLRSSLRDRVLAVLLLLIGCMAVIEPRLTQTIADMVGVGRGTDLTFYVFALGFVFFAILIYSKASRQSRALTEVTRRLAIVESDIHAARTRHDLQPTSTTRGYTRDHTPAHD